MENNVIDDELEMPLFDDLIEELSEKKYNEKIIGCINIILYEDGMSVFNLYDRAKIQKITLSPENIIGALELTKSFVISDMNKMRDFEDEDFYDDDKED